MKKVCFLIGNLNNSGGTERVTTLIANGLSKQNYQVSILSLADGTQPFFQLEENIRTYSLFPYQIPMKKNFIKAVWCIRKFVIQHKIDTLVVVDSITCVFTVPALLGLNIKHICWEHFNFNVNLNVKFRDLGRKWAAKYCDIVITLTERDKKLWQNGLKKIKANILSIPNPVPYENIDHHPTLKNKIVLAVGRLTYQKGFDLLLEAWQKVCESCQDWTLRIIGSGEDEIFLKQRAQKLGIQERVDFIPVTSNIEFYYKNSSFYCLSSRFEGFGMVLLEAQAFGLPVISFDCDAGPSDIIKSEENGFLVENLNVQLLANQLLVATKMSVNHYNAMSDSAILNSKRYYIDNIVHHWVSLLENK